MSVFPPELQLDDPALGANWYSPYVDCQGFSHMYMLAESNVSYTIYVQWSLDAGKTTSLLESFSGAVGAKTVSAPIRARWMQIGLLPSAPPQRMKLNVSLNDNAPGLNALSNAGAGAKVYKATEHKVRSLTSADGSVTLQELADEIDLSVSGIKPTLTAVNNDVQVVSVAGGYTLDVGSAASGVGSVKLTNGTGDNLNADNTVSIGNSAGQTTQLTGGVAIGYQAGNDTQSANAVAVGTQAGQTDQGDNSVAIGLRAGQTFQGSFSGGSVAVGIDSGNTNQEQICIAIGSRSGFTGQKTQAIAIGADAGRYNQQAAAIAIGYLAGEGDVASNQQLGGAIAIGKQAGRLNQRNWAIAIGEEAGKQGQGISSIAIGRQCALLNQPQWSIAMGFDCAAPGATGRLAFGANMEAPIVPSATSEEAVSRLIPLEWNGTLYRLPALSSTATNLLTGGGAGTKSFGTVYLPDASGFSSTTVSSNIISVVDTTSIKAGSVDFDNGGVDDGRLRYTGATTKTFFVVYTASMSSSSSYDHFIAVNGVLIDDSKVVALVGNNTTSSWTCSSIVALNTNDILQGARISSTTQIYQSFNMRAFEI